MRTLAGFWWQLVRYGFRLLYNEMAFTYDIVSWLVSLGQWRCWQRAVLNYLPEMSQGRVLEIAHGTGNLQLDLRVMGYDTIGIDLSRNMGNLARMKLERNQFPLKLARSYAQTLPFASQSFIGAVSTFPTDFIVDSATLAEIYRVLQPGGILVVVLNGVFSGSGLLQTMLEWLYRVTGQREAPSVDVAEYFTGYGFDIRIVSEACSTSNAQLIILTKSCS